MYSFRNVILSRKGFDSSSGYGYSPFDPITGKYITIPIPIGKNERQIANKTRYAEVLIKPNYLPSINATDLRELIFHDSLRLSRKSRQEVLNNFAHVDPWLGPCPWLIEISNHHIGAFGQVNAAQGHLDNNAVGVGSLFLFFSRFVPIKDRENKLEFHIDYGKGAYFLYGWLKVGRIAKSMSDIRDEELKLRHPHATEDYFTKYRNNTIYISDTSLSDNSVIPGCGYFPKLSKKLLLSSIQHLQTPTIWELPGFFYEPNNRPTYLKNESRWTMKKDSSSCFVKVAARGQEFVFNSTPDFVTWFRDLIDEQTRE
jgi:hypothetical protein